MREIDKEEKVKHEMDEIETINIKLEHSVAKLLSQNERLHKEIEHLKKIYKDQFDSIKRTCALSKEHCDSLIPQLNSKSLKNVNLKGQIQEKVFVTASLQRELRRLKGKHVLDNATTIAPGMFKLDIKPLSHGLKNNRDAHEEYLKKTIENTDTIRGLVERARKPNPSEPLLDYACKFTKHVQELNRSQLMNFVSKFLGTVRFGNDQIAKIMRQYCDADLEVAFQKNTCFIRNLEGVDLLSRSRDTNLYTISLDDMIKTSPISLLSKASKTKSWLWHRRLSHLNFGKSKKSSHQPKAEDINQEKLYLLHMDLYGPMRVVSINGKKYILVVVDNYSRFTWVKFLRSKDVAHDTIIKCFKNIQVHLNATVRNVRIDNETEFVNQTLHDFYENVGISHQASIARTPQQNCIVKRRN
ncbi:retrovirus-related pol polyprotein from transposon TNT 1-94 [Tanacetum coccineum]